MSKETLEKINEDLNNLNMKVGIGIKFADNEEEIDCLQNLKVKLITMRSEFVKDIEELYYK